MKWWTYILAFLITPLGTPLSFTLWSGIAFDHGSFSGIISDFPKSLLYTAPIAYLVTLLMSIPAILILSRNRWLPFPAIVFVGAFAGVLTGLFAGFYIGGYDIKGMITYFTYDLVSIYAPSAISGMVCSIMYWGILTISLREKG